MSANIGNLEQPQHAKYERLIARAKKVPAPKTIVVHPCDEFLFARGTGSGRS